MRLVLSLFWPCGCPAASHAPEPTLICDSRSDEADVLDPLDAGLARCPLLGERAEVPPRAVWEWGFVERVSTGLFCTELGLDEGRELLRVARAWAYFSSEPMAG